jgi:release factor glutamine methyltransferase
VSTTRATLASATTALESVSATPRLDAELLLAHALRIEREQLHFGDYAVPDSYAGLVARRLANEPIAYITGARDFWTVTLRVTPDVLIPRPDSETLIEAAVAYFGKAGPRRVLDLGTGSGALLLAALDQWPAATGVGIDASDGALRVARDNAAQLGLGARAAIMKGSWTGTGDRFDLILCNPPYIARGEILPPDVANWEPGSALFAGDDGLDDYCLIAPALVPQLEPGGIACVEIGHTQRGAVTRLFEEQGFSVSCRADLASHDRCLIVQFK